MKTPPKTDYQKSIRYFHTWGQMAANHTNSKQDRHRQESNNKSTILKCACGLRKHAVFATKTCTTLARDRGQFWQSSSRASVGAIFE